MAILQWSDRLHTYQWLWQVEASKGLLWCRIVRFPFEVTRLSQRWFAKCLPARQKGHPPTALQLHVAHFPFGRKQRGVGSRKPFRKWENRPDVLENREGKVRNRTKRKSQWLMPHTHKIHLFIRKNCDFVCIQRISLYICNNKTKQETNRTMFLNKNTYWWWRNSRPEKSWGDSLICISNHIPMWRHGGLSYLRQASFFIPIPLQTTYQ